MFGSEALRSTPPATFSISFAVSPLRRPLGAGAPRLDFCLIFCPDVYFIITVSFLWKVTVITLVSCLPLYILKYLRRRFSPPNYSKLTS